MAITNTSIHTNARAEMAISRFMYECDVPFFHANHPAFKVRVLVLSPGDARNLSHTR